MRTNIHIDEDLIVEIRKLTGLATKREIVASALRYYVAALREDDFEPSRALGDAMRREQHERVMEQSPEERVARALELGRRQLELAAEREGISIEEARARHEARKARPRHRR